MKLFC